MPLQMQGETDRNIETKKDDLPLLPSDQIILPQKATDTVHQYNIAETAGVWNSVLQTEFQMLATACLFLSFYLTLMGQFHFKGFDRSCQTLFVAEFSLHRRLC